MVSWIAGGANDPLLWGYDGASRQYEADVYHFATDGVVVDVEANTRLGWGLQSPPFSVSTYPQRPKVSANINVTAGDITANGITLSNGKGIVVSMFTALATDFDPSVDPTPSQVMAAPSVQRTRSGTYIVAAGTHVDIDILGPALQQNTKYFVVILPMKYNGSGSLDTMLVGVDPDVLARGLSVWSNRTPGAPTITSPAMGTTIDPGDTFTLSYVPHDPDEIPLSPDADRLNLDLAGVEFQYAAQATPDNPTPEWQPLEFWSTAASVVTGKKSWDIKGTVEYGDHEFLRLDLGGTVTAGVDPYPYVAEQGTIPSGEWQIRCRTFDFGHGYPLVARPGGLGPAGAGLTPSQYPAVNTSPWSEAVKISVPAPVLPPIPLSPRDNVAVAIGGTVRLNWQYRSTFNPPFDQNYQLVEIRKVGDPLWSTISSQVSGNWFFDLPPEFPGSPGGNYEYLSDPGFELETTDDWYWDWILAEPSVPGATTNIEFAGLAHSGNNFLQFTCAVDDGYSTLNRQFDLRPQDTAFTFTGWYRPHDSVDHVEVTLIWLDEDDNPLPLPGNNGICILDKATGDSWGTYQDISTSPDVGDPPGPVDRPAGAYGCIVNIYATGDMIVGTTDHLLDDVSFVGTEAVTDPFTLEVGSWYEWRALTGDTEGEVSNYSEPARFWMVPLPSSGSERPTPSENIDGATLGCGTHRVEIFRRGGTHRVGELRNISHVDWERKRDDISTAEVVISDWDIDCGNLLASLQTWAYEIVIHRYNGFTEDRVWEGPITLLSYESDKVTIDAKDVMGYAYRRILKQAMKSVDETVVDRARQVLQNVFAPDDPNVLAYLTVLPNEDDTSAKYRSTPAYARTGFEEVDDMASNTGLDYTVVGRAILLWGTRNRIGTLPEFRDENLGASPIVSEYGMNMANRYAISDGNGIWGEATRLDEYGDDETYGLVEMLSSTWADDADNVSGTYTPEAIQTTIEKFEKYAERSIADRYGPPVVVRIPDNTSLNPNTVISIQQLVPGVVIPLRSTQTLRTVVGNQKLDSVKVVEESGNEVISVTMSSFNRDDTETVEGAE